jgi:hypothetical protein
MASAQNLALGPFLLRADHSTFEGHAFRVILTEPSFAGFRAGEDFEVLGVAESSASLCSVPPEPHSQQSTNPFARFSKPPRSGAFGSS